MKKFDKNIKNQQQKKQSGSGFILLTAMALCAALLNPLQAMAEAAKPPAGELSFLTWEEYIDEDLLAAFEQKFNARVKFTYYDSDESRNEILASHGIQAFDLMLVDRVSLVFYKELDWIAPFDSEKAPNLKYLELPLQSDKNEGQICAAYAWGTTGIAYRKDLVPEPVTRWEQIFKPAPELHGKILMSTLAEEVVGMALKSLGYPMYSSNRTQLEEARNLLLQQRPSVAGYSSIAAEKKNSKLVTGEIVIVTTYSGDALMLQEVEPKIEYVLPEEGGAIWADYICLSGKAKNQELAHQFVNFINEPENAALNAQFFYSATPNKMAEKLLPAEFLNNPVIYPSPEALAHSEMYQPIPPRTVKKQNAIMNELRRLSQKEGSEKN